MKSAWQVVTYLKTEDDVDSPVIGVFSFTFVCVSDKRPSDNLVRSVVSQYTSDCEPLFSEVTYAPVPEELLP